jgi:hypothetical protein
MTNSVVTNVASEAQIVREIVEPVTLSVSLSPDAVRVVNPQRGPATVHNDDDECLDLFRFRVEPAGRRPGSPR